MLNNIMQILPQLSKCQNPMSMMMQMFGNNPQFQQALQVAQNKTPQQLEEYVRNICKTQNIDIDNLIKMFPLK